jgi:filamentous hemagglutinin
VGSTLSGNTVTIAAGQNLSVTGSNIVGTGDVSLAAGNNLSVTSAQSTSYQASSVSTTTSGLMGASSGIGFSIGTSKQSNASTDSSTTQVASNIGSLTGNLSLSAGAANTITGSSLYAAQNLSVTGSTVNIGSSFNTDTFTQTSSSSFTGFSASISSPAIAAGEGAVASIQQAGSVQNAQLQDLLAIQAGTDVATASQALTAKNGGILAGGQVSLSFGTSSESSSSTTTTNTAVGSTLTGTDVAVIAMGGDLDVTGSTISGTNIALQAAQNINLTAAQNTSTTQTTNSASSTSIGVSLAVGQQASAPSSNPGKNMGLPTFSLSTSSSNSNSTSNATQQVNTIVAASGNLSLTSGGNTTLSGAQVSGNSVLANIAGNLDLTSLQDTSTYNGSSSSMSAGVSVTGNVVSGSLSFSNGTTNSTYASVINQTGIYAGAGGFNISVGQNTNLTGAVIASTADALLNQLATGTLTYSNVQNTASYSANTSGFGISAVALQNGPAIKAGTGLTSSGLAGNASSTTAAAISPGTIAVGSAGTTAQNSLVGLSRDTNNATNALNQIFNAQTVSEDQQIGALAGELGMTAVGNLADNLSKSSNPQTAALFAEGGLGRDLLHGLVGGATAALDGGSVLGGAAGAAAGAAVMAIPTALKASGIAANTPAGSALEYLATDVLSGAVGSAVGGALDGAAGAGSGQSSTDQGVIDNALEQYISKNNNSSGALMSIASNPQPSSAPAPTAATVVYGPNGALPGSATGYINASLPSDPGSGEAQFWNAVAQGEGLTPSPEATSYTDALKASSPSALQYAAGVGAISLNPGWGTLGGTAAGLGDAGEAAAAIGTGLLTGGALLVGAAAVAAFGPPSLTSGPVGTPQPMPGPVPGTTTAFDGNFSTSPQGQALFNQLAGILGLSPVSTTNSNLYTPPIASLTGASDASGSQPNSQNIAAVIPNTATPPNPTVSPSPGPSPTPPVGTAIQQATDLFASNSPGVITIGDNTFTEIANPGNAAMFQGASESQVQQFFMDLTDTTELPAPQTIPGKGTIYVVNTPNGNFTLRDFAGSSDQTGPVWTINIPKAAVGTTYNPEIKFLQ